MSSRVEIGDRQQVLHVPSRSPATEAARGRPPRASSASHVACCFAASPVLRLTSRLLAFPGHAGRLRTVSSCLVDLAPTPCSRHVSLRSPATQAASGRSPRASSTSHRHPAHDHDTLRSPATQAASGRSPRASSTSHRHPAHVTTPCVPRPRRPPPDGLLVPRRPRTDTLLTSRLRGGRRRW